MITLSTLTSCSVLLSAKVLAQNPVEIQFQTDPLQVQTGTEIVFTVLTVSRVLSMTWKYQGVALGLWSSGTSTINPVAQFTGRLTIAATQLRIGGAQLGDAGSYTVEVIPLAPTDLVPNSRTVQLSVFSKEPMSVTLTEEIIVGRWVLTGSANLKEEVSGFGEKENERRRCNQISDPFVWQKLIKDKERMEPVTLRFMLIAHLICIAHVSRCSESWLSKYSPAVT